jgi:hypothetical protein
MMYQGREDQRGDDRRATPRGERPFGRRIDCAENGGARSVTPARGGGQRNLDAMTARPRDHRG